MSESIENGDKPAWVQLYEARRRAPPPRLRPRGRPPMTVPRKSTHIRLSDGERGDILHWQDRFSAVLKRNVSLGETAGILARICSERLVSLDPKEPPDSLSDLVDLMVSGEH